VRHFALAIALISATVNGGQAPPPVQRDGIVVIGDSIAHGAGDETGRGLAGNLHATNLGINGARTSNVNALLRHASAQSIVRAANAIIVSIGGNDLYGDSVARLMTTIWPSHAIDRTIDRVAAVVARIRRLNPTARICLLGLYNPYRTPALDLRVAQWDARLIARFASDRGVQVIRIADLFVWRDRLSRIDRFHPGAEGYACIAARISAILPRT
jgi:lysophospholipase L1-like esterase